jgi:hypothetical protein
VLATIALIWSSSFYVVTISPVAMIHPFVTCARNGLLVPLATATVRVGQQR